MTEFATGRLWTIVGKVRAVREVGKPVRTWDSRLVVITADDYQQAHERAQDALLHNWSSQPHEAVVFAVRPAIGQDLDHFKYDNEPTLRVLVGGVS